MNPYTPPESALPQPPKQSKSTGTTGKILIAVAFLYGLAILIAGTIGVFTGP